MQKQTTEPTVVSSVTWEHLEACLRGRMREWIQDLLEAEVDALLGRRKSERRKAVDGVRATGAGTASRGGTTFPLYTQKLIALYTLLW